jgi:hypothetical protein
MTTERIDRLEALAETILLAIQQQAQQQQELQRELRASIHDTVSMISTLATEMHVMQGDIRGLQLENRRILDTLLNQQNGNQ